MRMMFRETDAVSGISAVPVADIITVKTTEISYFSAYTPHCKEKSIEVK